MSIEFEDVSGEPQPISSLERALECVKKAMMNHGLMVSAPEFFVEIVTIKDALEELIAIRRALENPKK